MPYQDGRWTISDDLAVHLAYLPPSNEDAFGQECYTLCVRIRTCILVDTCTSGPGFSVDTCTSGPGFSVDTCTSGPGFSVDTCTSVDTNLPPTDSPRQARVKVLGRVSRVSINSLTSGKKTLYERFNS